MKRRSFLGLMAGAPVVGPAIAKDLVEVGVPQMGIEPTMPAMGVLNDALTGEGSTADADMTKADLIKLAFRTPQLMEDLKALARRRSEVNKFDPDLAVNRSMSLPAKMAIQRQRNYDRALHALLFEHEPVWQRIYRQYKVYV